MTIYIIIPAGDPDIRTAVENSYLDEHVRGEDAPNEDEALTWIREGPGYESDYSGVSASGPRMITGTSRASAAQVENVRAGNEPNVTVANEWPVDWVFPGRSDGSSFTSLIPLPED